MAASSRCSSLGVLRACTAGLACTRSLLPSVASILRLRLA